MSHRLRHFFLALVILGLPPTLGAQTIKSSKTTLFEGTIFVVPNLITADDPSTFTKLLDKGQAERSMFDRRLNGFTTYNAFLFEAVYSDSAPIEIQVNPEFQTVAAAREQAEKYARCFGQLPQILRSEVKSSWIHMGDKPYGGGNHNILIHTDQTLFYERLGVLEEALFHEATHTSIDSSHALAKGWVAAQNRDPAFASGYALNNPGREDLSESYLLYFALRYRPVSLPQGAKALIENGMPARMAYFDTLPANMSPWPQLRAGTEK